MSDVELTSQFLSSSKNSNYILFPKNVSEFPSGEGSEWLIIIHLENWKIWRDYAVQIGITALDSVFKLTKYHFPIWLWVTTEPSGRGITGFVIIASHNKATLLSKALSLILAHVNWEQPPAVIIDHDKVERSALVRNKVLFVSLSASY